MKIWILILVNGISSIVLAMDINLLNTINQPQNYNLLDSNQNTENQISREPKCKTSSDITICKKQKDRLEQLDQVIFKYDACKDLKKVNKEPTECIKNNRLSKFDIVTNWMKNHPPLKKTVNCYCD